MCFSFALWNEADPFLKERLFGVTGHEGNHGEDVKEIYYYLDSTPTHSYMQYLYKYPQRPFPYEALVRENQQRNREVVEFEILDTDAFDDDKYWDVFVEYAKDENDPDAISIRITAVNRGPEAASLHIVPQLFFRNTWSWPKERPSGKAMPSMKAVSDTRIVIEHETLGPYYLNINPSAIPSQPPKEKRSQSKPASPVVSKQESSKTGLDTMIYPELLFTENETNFSRLYNGTNKVPFVKDAFHDHIVPGHWKAPTPNTDGNNDESEDKSSEDNSPSPDTPSTPKVPQFVNPERTGTKAGIHYVFKDVPPNGGFATVRLKLTSNAQDPLTDIESIDNTLKERKLDADEFYARLNTNNMSDDLANIMRQALAGMLWTKQFYYFVQKEWLEGDPGQPTPPPERQWVRNRVCLLFLGQFVICF